MGKVLDHVGAAVVGGIIGAIAAGPAGAVVGLVGGGIGGTEFLGNGNGNSTTDRASEFFEGKYREYSSDSRLSSSKRAELADKADRIREQRERQQSRRH